MQEKKMADERKVNQSVIRLQVGDITDLDIECFVYYARPDLKLGSGYGGAITVRGGPTIQKELDGLAPIKTGEAVITAGGELKSQYIIHANGPKFQEENLEEKLETIVANTLKLADEKGIKKIALPPMGTGFYGAPLKTSAKICIETAENYLKNGSGIEEVVFCLLDNREYLPFKEALNGRA
jgi:O-acetyl-ADP-ribose deacetylase (regulator of RNase III)